MEVPKNGFIAVVQALSTNNCGAAVAAAHGQIATYRLQPDCRHPGTNDGHLSNGRFQVSSGHWPQVQADGLLEVRSHGSRTGTADPLRSLARSLASVCSRGERSVDTGQSGGCVAASLHAG